MAETTQEATEEKTEQTQAQNVDLSETAETEPSGAAGSIDILLNMGVSVTVSVGQTEIPVRQLLQLGPGSVVKLDKPVDAPADLYLRDSKFATGTIVVVDNCFAVKIKQVLGLDDDEDANPAAA